MSFSKALSQVYRYWFLNQVKMRIILIIITCNYGEFCILFFMLLDVPTASAIL